MNSLNRSMKMMADMTLHQRTTKRLVAGVVAGLAIELVGCQTAPPPPPPKPHVILPPKPHVVAPPPISTVTPQPAYGYPPLQTQGLPPQAPQPPQPQIELRDGHNIPLVQNLMALGMQQLQQNQLDNAEETYDRVQRIAPQYASVYARLSEVALRKKDGATAEGMARRGLIMAKSPQQKAGFWQLIALAGAMENKPDVVNEAKLHLGQ